MYFGSAIKSFKGPLLVVLFLALGLVTLALQAPSAKTPGTGKAQQAGPKIGFLGSPLLLPGEISRRFPQGNSMVFLATDAQSFSPVGPPVPLAPQFFAVAGPQVSFDGSRILFAGQKEKGATWQIWEMALDGAAPRPITHCTSDCLQPAYLPRDQIVYTAFTGTGPQRSSAIYVCQRDGTKAHPITFGPGNFQVETVLRSGRVLVSAASPLLAGGTGGNGWGHRALYLVRPDGSGLGLFRQDATMDPISTGAEELDNGAVLFVQGRGAVVPQPIGGGLAWVPQGALRPVQLTAPPSLYESARELHAGTLIVSRQTPGLSAADRTFDLYTFDLASQTLGKRLYHQAKLSSISPFVIAPHPAPLYYPSILHLEEKTGRVLCLNSYVSADAPHGRIATPIAQVRVVALEQGGREQTLGNAPVEKDGSFYIKVPADTPIRFALLDAKGRVIRAQKSWIWARPGEDRGCLGCHEDQALAPENHWPLTLSRFDTPTPVGVPAQPQEKHPEQ
ncbi:MAG: hypothetical protein ACP5EP_02275 [Acidobacteriaceae bacterium]